MLACVLRLLLDWAPALRLATGSERQEGQGRGFRAHVGMAGTSTAGERTLVVKNDLLRHRHPAAGLCIAARGSNVRGPARVVLLTTYERLVELAVGVEMPTPPYVRGSVPVPEKTTAHS